MIVAALALALPSLGLGFGVDEHGFRAALAAGHASALELYRFATGDAQEHDALVRHGLLPWWSAPGFRLHFVRPLASLLFAADARWFGDHAVLYHVHSLLWYAALLIVSGRLFRAALPARAALLALAVYGFANAHVQAYASPAARHVLIASVWSALALWALCARSRFSGGERRALAVVCSLVALSASEAALMGLALYAAFELADAWTTGSVRASWRSWRALPLGLFVAYASIYRLMGAGEAFGGGYRDPLRDPRGFLVAIPSRLFVALGDALAGVPSELAFGHPAGVLVALGVGATTVVGLVLMQAWPRLDAGAQKALVWLLPGSLASIVLGLGGLPTGRVLLVPDLGFAALLGLLLDAAWRAHSSPVGRAFAVVFAVLHLGVAPAMTLVSLARSYRLARAAERIAGTAPLSAGTRRAFVIASDPYAFLFARGVLADDGRRVCWSVLSAARGEHLVRRSPDGSLELEPQRPLGYGPFEALFRDPALPFTVGTSVRQCGAEFRVEAVERGHVSRFSVRVAHAGDAAFLFWDGRRFATLDLPPAGRTIAVEWSPGPARVF